MDEIERLSRRDAGMGSSDKIVDCATWLPDVDQNAGWYEALAAIDGRRQDKAPQDKAPLLALLRSDSELPATVRHHLADLLERHELRRRRGGQQVPSYDRSDAEAALHSAISQARDYVQNGMSVSDALEKAAESNCVDRDKLDNAYAGQRGSTRRVNRRAAKR
jgi:hypothetical protein